MWFAEGPIAAIVADNPTGASNPPTCSCADNWYRESGSSELSVGEWVLVGGCG